MLDDREEVETEIESASEALDYDYVTDENELYIVNSNVPYHHTLKKTLAAKSNILINGFIPPAAQRFSVDLCTHSFDKSKNKKVKEIVFHFNPRFGQNCVVRNSFLTGEWGPEEMHASKKNPFKRGLLFIMEIYVMKTEYLVSVNGVHFCSYTHRVSPSTVDSIDISGDIQLLKVELSVRDMYPSTGTQILLDTDPQNKLGTPYIYNLPPSGLRIGSKIEVKARVKLLPQRFHIRLQCGPEVYPQPVVPYQLSAIWLPEQQLVTLNTWIHEQSDWGPEIVCPNAFKPNSQFSLLIVVDKFGFRTEIAQFKFPMLEHSAQLAAINTVYLKTSYFHELKYPLMEKWDLIIAGTLFQDAERFAIDLCADCVSCSKSHKNIIFHFNPRVTQNYVARNSCLHEQWGVEESHAYNRNPFRRGENFILEIFVSDNYYLVSVNGKHFCSFQHRMAPLAVQSFEVSGDVWLRSADITLKDSYPTHQLSLYPSLEFFLKQMSVPVLHRLNAAMAVDSVIEIEGRTLLLPHEFFVNLQRGCAYYPHPIVPYHLSVRWCPFNTDATVVNSWIAGRWDEEIVTNSFLRPNSQFRLTIFAKKEGISTVIKTPKKPYSIVLPLLPHRTDLAFIDTVYILGDVQIHAIDFRNV